MSHQKITPFLWFESNAEEAVGFYISVFRNSRVLGVSRYGEGMPLPKGAVMTVAFELFGQRFTAMNGGPRAEFTQAVSFVVNCETQGEIDEYWEKLTSGGGSPVQCGWLKDRYGLSWQIVPTMLWGLINDPVKSEKVMGALVQMVKLEITKLRAAAEG